ncbi:MAG: hypothetical protein Hens3KO_05430 [Henriciella sp.]
MSYQLGEHLGAIIGVFILAAVISYALKLFWKTGGSERFYAGLLVAGILAPIIYMFGDGRPESLVRGLILYPTAALGIAAVKFVIDWSGKG